MGLGEVLESVRDEPRRKFTSSLIKNIKCTTCPIFVESQRVRVYSYFSDASRVGKDGRTGGERKERGLVFDKRHRAPSEVGFFCPSCKSLRMRHVSAMRARGVDVDR